MRLHDATGEVDYITCGYGSYLEFEGIIPPFTHAEKLTTPMTALLKQAVTHARITSEAHVRTPENGETIIASGEADLVSIVRGQIADPHLARKTAEGRAERHPLLHLVQPDVLGATVARLLDLLPDKPIGGARVRMGRRQVRPGCCAAQHPCRRGRTGGAGGGQGRSRAWSYR